MQQQIVTLSNCVMLGDTGPSWIQLRPHSFEPERTHGHTQTLKGQYIYCGVCGVQGVRQGVNGGRRDRTNTNPFRSWYYVILSCRCRDLKRYSRRTRAHNPSNNALQESTQF